MRISAHREHWELSEPFHIASASWTHAHGVVVQVESGGCIGRGEAQGIFYLDETADVVLATVESVIPRIRQGINRDELQSILPPGGARNAIDCALWDLECKLAGKSVWALAGIAPKPCQTVFTIGISESPGEMAAAARAAANCAHLKVKLDTHRTAEKIEAIREARPDAELVIDANQTWNLDLLEVMAPLCADLGVRVIEQPLPRGDDKALESVRFELPIAADESCLHLGELDTAALRYQMINIKLDKCGGLTEGLRIAKEARARGLDLMVGNMMGTSLGMAPAFVVAQLCDLVDLDGPMLLKHDHPLGMSYANGVVGDLRQEFWG